jgi:hypothetical protein
MSEYFCHGCVVYYDKNNNLRLEECDCTEQDILLYSAYKGIPLLQISIDAPCVFENTWQGFFNKSASGPKNAKFHEKVNYNLLGNRWISRWKNSTHIHYILITITATNRTWLGVSEHDMSLNPLLMSLNPLLEYLPQFHQQQKINTQERLTHFLIQDIASDITTFFE